MKSDIEIAREYTLAPIETIAAKLGAPPRALRPYGREIAKLDSDFLASLKDGREGKLILVTAINPTPAGEGKTTTTIGLGDALNRLGKRAAIALREPSLGPCFGQKGGATGGGRAQVAPMDEINLHFTGDFHAISTAHNLLSAMLDNHLYWGNALDIDPRRVVWRRALDMNDRALREITVGLGGVPNGFPRTDRFDITVASEVMAVFCLSASLAELEERLGRIIVAETRAKTPVFARDLKASSAMAALLLRALEPNLVQTLEGSPALVHGGPFANIAHGCNSIIATRAALRLTDYVVTEAGFGADLGAEKFFNIKCRQANLKPSCAVVVATVRALKMNGGVAKGDLAAENLEALRRGLPNLERHVENIRKFGLEPIVAINRFDSDSAAELALAYDVMRAKGVNAVVNESWGRGAAGDKRSPKRCSRRSNAAAPISNRSIPTTCRSSTRSGRSPAKSTAPTMWSPTPGWSRGSSNGRTRGMGDCRSAPPRHNIPSPPIRPRSGPRPVSRCRCATCACAPAPASS